MSKSSLDDPRGPRSFLTTRWSVVQAAAGKDPGAARDALATLCETTWYPLYAFVRRSGWSDDDARDLTQAFFARLLERRDYAAADPERGRFRSFLLASLKNFLANERDRARTLKRGGGRALLSIDFADADTRYGLDPGDGRTPERVFERTWALTLIQRTVEELGAEYARRGQAELFEVLRASLVPGREGPSRREQAEALGMTEGALKVALHRLRRRYGQLLRREIGETLEDPERVDEEIRDLFAILSA